MLSQLFSIIAPVLLIAGVGFSWSKAGRPYDVELVTALVTTLGTPCLVFATLAGVDLAPDAFAHMALASAAALGSCMALGWIVLRIFKLNVSAFLPALMFPNSGNMGLPLCLLAFGEQGLALAIGFFTVAAVGQFTVGAAVASGTLSLGKLARLPMVYAALAGVLFLATGTKPPAWILNTSRILGEMTIPLMLLTLGISLASLKVNSLTRSLALSLLRLGMGFGVGLAVASLMGLEGVARGVLIVEISMPTAVFNYLFAVRFKTRPEEVAGMVILSTVISFATLPLLLWYVL